MEEDEQIQGRLNNTINKLDLTAICVIPRPSPAEYMLFSNAHETFLWIDHMVGHKTNLNNFKKY